MLEPYNHVRTVERLNTRGRYVRNPTRDVINYGHLVEAHGRARHRGAQEEERGGEEEEAEEEDDEGAEE